FTASNQIFKDLRNSQPAYRIPATAAGLETSPPASPTHQKARQDYTEGLKLFKEPNRKAVFRPTQWPAQSFVTIPCRGSYPLYHLRVAVARASAGFRGRRARFQTLNFGDFPRVSLTSGNTQGVLPTFLNLKSTT